MEDLSHKRPPSQGRSEPEKQMHPRITGEESPRLGYIILLLFLVLVFGVSVGLYVLVGARTPPSFSSEKSSAPEKTQEEQKDIAILISHSPREQILADIIIAFGKTILPPNGIRKVLFTVNDTNGEGLGAATTSALLSQLALTTPPERLLRSLDTTATYGIYSSNNLVGFLQLRSRSYRETFAGMLEWEPAMGSDLIPALHPKVKRADIRTLRGRPFQDEQVGGIDARVLSDPDGVVALAYAFPDKETLIIAGSRDTLRALIPTAKTENKK